MHLSAIVSLASLSLLPGLASGAAAGPAHKKGPVIPDAEPLFQLQMNLGQSVDFGLGPRGNRFGDPIVGGAFEGPKLTGVVLPVGGDWGLLDAKGGFIAITVMEFQTNDGANIFVRTTGPTPNGRGLNYISLETGHPNYYWVNDMFAFGLIQVDRQKGAVTIEAWSMVAPTD
ncbi:hypothetical protein CMUS01_05342 [Colletotrichum musicola]|uniref:Uncharacterized protein n=1 Tax=Colletotrichum musicola TaxID=2175873 RepID=A0A8H6KSR2_9PEZI|nr:hypothetical protein CMUS01_05342 [Colletotrichum musicola]